MKSFTDNMDSAWTLVVNVATIKRECRGKRNRESRLNALFTAG